MPHEPLTRWQILSLLDVATRVADKLQVKVSIAVVDLSGELLGFMRMDHTDIASIELAQQAAAEAIKLHNGTLLDQTLRGGVVLWNVDGSEIVGALGIYGLAPEHDAAIAKKARHISEMAPIIVLP